MSAYRCLGSYRLAVARDTIRAWGFRRWFYYRIWLRLLFPRIAPPEFHRSRRIPASPEKGETR